jgi:hypothetical protein
MELLPDTLLLPVAINPVFFWCLARIKKPRLAGLGVKQSWPHSSYGGGLEL